MKKIFIIFLLCGCAVSGLQIEKNIFVVEKDTKIKPEKDKCKYESSFIECKKRYNVDNISIKKDNYKLILGVNEDFKIKPLSASVFPIIPIPPIIPFFFIPEDCYGEFCKDKYLKITLDFFTDYNNTIDNINIDLNSIYLLINNKKMYASNYEIKHDKFKEQNWSRTSVIVDFPIKIKKSKNSLLFIDNIKVNDEKIQIPVSKIVYKSTLAFATGYMVNN